jgi:hypothetical protein
MEADMKIRSLGLLLLLTLLVLAAPLLIAGTFAQEVEWGNLPVVLASIAAGPLALYLAGKALAYVFEILPGWGVVVPDWARGPIVLLATVGLMFGADYALSQMPVIALIAPYYRRIIEVAILFLGSQVGYANLKAAGLRAERKLPTPS